MSSIWDQLVDRQKKLIEVIDQNKDIIAGDDGFYIFWPTRISSGALTAQDLRIIADELDRRNAPWQSQLEKYFEETPNPNDQHTQEGGD